MKRFDLNIEKVLEDWGVRHALREVIANALDEQALTRTRDIDIFQDKQGRWHIRDYGRGLKYEHLTQKEDQEKQSRPDLVVGKFGVGLKDALATFDRRKINVLMKSRHCDITTAKSSKHGFEDITTLHAVIDDASEPNTRRHGLRSRGRHGCGNGSGQDFFLRFSGDKPIETTKYGQVLDKGERKVARSTSRGYELRRKKTSCVVTTSPASMRPSGRPSTVSARTSAELPTLSVSKPSSWAASSKMSRNSWLTT